MLSQDERRRFNEIAHQLTADADFTRLVRSSLPRHRPPARWLTGLCVLLGVAVPILLALRWWVAAVVTLGALSAAIVTALILRRRRSPH